VGQSPFGSRMHDGRYDMALRGPGLVYVLTISRIDDLRGFLDSVFGPFPILDVSNNHLSQQSQQEKNLASLPFNTEKVIHPHCLQASLKHDRTSCPAVWRKVEAWGQIDVANTSLSVFASSP